MQLTKFAHACFTVTIGGEALIVDPGNYSSDFIMPRKVAAIIITHDHPDHLDRTLMQKIIDTHPHAIIIGCESITTQYGDRQTITARPGETQKVGSFSLTFFGGDHASITEGLAVPTNIGIIINETLCYAGDSFALPPAGMNIQALALPVSAPWLRIDDAIQYLNVIRPSFTFPTHDAILSAQGKALVDRLVGGIAQGLHVEYRRINETSIELFNAS